MPLPRTKKVPAKPLRGIAANELNVAKDGSTIKLWMQVDGKVWEFTGTDTTVVPSGGSGAAFVYRAGDTMTGALTLSGLPTADLHAAGKGYVDQTAKRFAILFG